MELLKRFWKEEEGQDLVEYALLLGFISLALITALSEMQSALNTVYSSTATKLEGSGS